MHLPPPPIWGREASFRLDVSLSAMLSDAGLLGCSDDQEYCGDHWYFLLCGWRCDTVRNCLVTMRTLRPCAASWNRLCKQVPLSLVCAMPPCFVGCSLATTSDDICQTQ